MAPEIRTLSSLIRLHFPLRFATILWQAAKENSGNSMNFSPLDLNQAPVLAPQTLQNWGRTLAIAAHPGDESLGCGGTLALLAQMRVPVAVVWVSDGAASHRNSRVYAPPKLVNLREAEAKMALDKLGVGRKNGFFLRLPDGRVPFPDDPDFEVALGAAREVLGQFAPQTLLLPWRREVNRDHRASWQLFSRAAQELEIENLQIPTLQIQSFEYLMGAFQGAAPEDWPQNSEASAFAVDISGARALKRSAMDAHASQTTRLIKDDPNGVWLTPELLEPFCNAHEAWIAPFCSIPEVAGRAKPRANSEVSSGA